MFWQSSTKTMTKFILTHYICVMWQSTTENKRMAKTPKIPVLHIFHNNDAHLYYAKVREDKVYLKGEKVAQFTNRGVFTVKDYTQRRKRKFKALIYLDGKAKSCKIGGEKAEQLAKEFLILPETEETIFEPLTDRDRKIVVKREIAKQLGKFKPMETWQFILIITLLAALIAIQFIF